MFLRQSTSQVVQFGPCLDIGDGVTEEVALTLAQADMRLSKDGGAFAQKSAAGNATHDSDGWYSTTLSTTDTDTVGILKLNVHQPANMFPVWENFYVVEEAVYDAMYAAAAAGPLQSTTAGRTLDILATGEVPVDFDTSIGTLAAAQFEAGALDGKGDWNIDKTGYTLTQAFPTNFADMSITVTTGLVDITQAAADKAWSTAARVLTAGTNIALAKGVGLTGLNDIPATDIVSAGAITTLAGAVANVDLVDTVTTLTGHTAQTGDSYARLGAPAGASVSADILAIDNFVDGLETTIGVAGAGLTDLGGMSTGMKAEVNAEMVDVITVDTIAELSQAIPAATPTVATALMLMYMPLRNKLDVTASIKEVHNDAGAVIATKALTDDGTTYSEAEMIAGT